MNAPVPFQFEGVAVRVVEIDGEPLFSARDVAQVLGYTDPARAVRQHCKGRAKRLPLPTSGGLQECRVVGEPDVLRLIVGSKLPTAERFERWVFEEVLPEVRRTGRYGPPAPQADPLKALSDPATMRALLLTYTEQVIERDKVIAEQAPKVAALERLTAAEGTVNITEAAKSLQMRPRDLFKWMNSRGWIYRRPGGSGWVAFQKRIDSGMLEHRIVTLRVEGEERMVEQVRVTSRGLARLAELMEKDIRAA